VFQLDTYGHSDEFGFIETPYRKVDLDTHAITDQIDYLTADEEDSYV
jgi:DNA-directed RNA polymerase subunit beta